MLLYVLPKVICVYTAKYQSRVPCLGLSAAQYGAEKKKLLSFGNVGSKYLEKHIYM